MKTVADLRELAAGKRRTAALARRLGPSLSVARDRVAMAQHAADLEAAALALDSEADAIEPK
jgi:hypothetical protein